jgi:hypothetical protein
MVKLDGEQAVGIGQCRVMLRMIDQAVGLRVREVNPMSTKILPIRNATLRGMVAAGLLTLAVAARELHVATTGDDAHRITYQAAPGAKVIIKGSEPVKGWTQVTNDTWLDWMTQGTQVTRNLLHDNHTNEDLFIEVNHGPFLVDHNICLSRQSLNDWSQGGAYAHNLFAGAVLLHPVLDRQDRHPDPQGMAAIDPAMPRPETFPVTQ